MDINGILAFGIPALALVVGLVEVSKKLGASGTTCLILAIVYGVIVMVLQQVVAILPVIEPWVRAVFWGIVIGLAASGLYDLSKKFLPGGKP